jgi:hypothetical protein
MKDITLTLSPQQLDVIFRGLMELPTKYTLELIEEIKKQLAVVTQPDKLVETEEKAVE